MSSPAVSVALPVYNVAPYLRACLDSIIGQDFQDMEIICVNDGSTDESPEILAEYAAKDPQIRIVNQSNKGLASTRNTALQHVRGRYLLHVDSDDILRKDAVALLCAECERTKADFIVFYHSMIEDDREFDSWYYDFDQWNLTPKTTLEQKLEILHYHYTWSKFFRMDFLKQHDFHFPEGLQFDDNIYHWQVPLAGAPRGEEGGHPAAEALSLSHAERVDHVAPWLTPPTNILHLLQRQADLQRAGRL